MTLYTFCASLAAMALFAALKLSGVIALSWWWLTIPSVIVAGLMIFIGLLLLAFR